MNGAQGYYCKRVGIGQVVEVGKFGANGYGLFDMAGNAGEWTSEGVLRGGAYDNFGKILFVAYMYNDRDDSTVGSNGFRCVGWPQ